MQHKDLTIQMIIVATPGPALDIAVGTRDGRKLFVSLAEAQDYIAEQLQAHFHAIDMANLADPNRKGPRG